MVEQWCLKESEIRIVLTKNQTNERIEQRWEPVNYRRVLPSDRGTVGKIKPTWENYYLLVIYKNVTYGEKWNDAYYEYAWVIYY